MSSNIVPASQIAQLKTGLDSILSPIKQALQTKVWAESLPIVGSLISSAASQGQAALAQFGSLETNVFNALNSFNNVSADVNTLQTAINNALVAAGFPKGGVVVGLDSSGILIVALNDQLTDTFSTALSSNFGLPGLDFQTSGSAATQLTYHLDVIGTVDTSGNFSVSEPNGPALTVNLGVTAPTFSADAILGDLRFGAVNNTSVQNGVENATSLQGTFSLDINGGATFTGDANLNLDLTSDMGTAALPSVSANLVGGWSFQDSSVDPNNAASFGDTPTIALDNVTFKLGTFVDNVIDPVINDVNSVLQSAPIQALETLFETPLSFLGGAGHMNNGTADPDGGLLGKFWHSLDVAGSIDANGQDVGDGTITLVDVLQMADVVDPTLGIDVKPLVEFLSALNQVKQWVSTLAGTGTSFGTDTYDLGSFTIPDDVRSAAQLISQAVPELIPGSQPIDLPTLLQNLVNNAGSSGGSNPPAQNPFQALQSLLNSNIFSFPIITNPAEAVQFLLGGTADLFDANLPAASFNFGSINAAGMPTATIPLLNVPIPVFPFITLNLGLGAAFQVSVALDFGYDTSGLSAFEKSGFTNYATLLSGLFVQSPTISGTVEPVVQLQGDVQVGATLSVPGAYASASGDIGGVLDLNFSQSGKNYISSLLSTLEGSHPFSIFNASGQVTAGFELVARALTFSPWVFAPQRITLANFGGVGAAGTTSGPAIPVRTTWVGGASGDFETSANWNPTFAAISGIDYYGDATIGAGSTVTFHGTSAADLTSLTLASNSVLNVAQGQLTVEDSTITSPDSGTIFVGGTANLVIEAGFKNTGTIWLTGGTLVASGLMDLSGGGSVLLPNARGSFIQSTDPNALLWNEDNTISGGGTIGANLLNDGTINANVSTPLVLAGLDSNRGLMEATGNGGAAGTPITGGLDINQSLDNTGGTLAAFKHGVVILEDGVTVTGGTLKTGSVADASLILTEGSVTLDGGTAGLAVAGNILADSGSTLTLTGLITSSPFSTSSSQNEVASGNGTVLLQGATIHNGFLNASLPANPTGGLMAVSGTATLDGSAGDGSIGIDGKLQVNSGNTLVVDGSINPGLEGGGIVLDDGTLVIGNAITSVATFGSSLPGSVDDTGSLTMNNQGDSVITGADAGSTLINEWEIFGAGTIGNGQLTLINAAGGTIGAGFGTLVIDSAVPVLNAGLIEAALGELDLQSNIINNGGTIASLLLDDIVLDGATVAGGVLSGGGLFFNGLSSFLASGHAMLDGSASPVTLRDDANVLVGAGSTLTLAGSIINDNNGLGRSTIAVEGSASIGGVAVLQASGSVTLSGGGFVSLTEASGAGTGYTQEITGVSGDTLDNVDNTIFGYGSIGVGDNTLTLINEAAGTIDANAAGDTLVVNAGTNIAINRGLLEATGGGTLDLHGSITNAGGTLLAAGGTALLDGAMLGGGAIASSGTGSVRVSGTATLDGRTSAITVAAGADVAVDAGDVLTALGTIINNGVMQATGGTLVVATGAVAVTNLGRLGADDGGVLDLRSNVSNAGGTIAVTTGDALLDGMTVTNGLLAGESPDTGFIDVVNSSTVIGTGKVAAGVNTAPTSGLLNTADLRVQGGATLTLQGIITNRGVISLVGNAGSNPTAALHTAGTVALTGGGTLTMQDSSAAESPESQIVTGTAATSTLDNIDNTISGEGLLGNADGLLTVINEAGGTVDAVGTSLIVNTGSHAIVNKGLLESTTGLLFLNGTVTNTGTIGAAGGATELDGATVNGGVLATTANGAIRTDGSATLNGIASAVTLATGAQVITGGADTLTLEGSIVNHGVLGLAGDSTNDLTATLRVLGTVTLSGGGTVSLASLNGGPSSTYQVITDPVASDTLDNIDNTIVGYGELGAGAMTLRNEASGVVEASSGGLVVNTGDNVVINDGLFAAVGGTLDLQGVVDSTGGGTLQALDLGVGGAPGIIVLDAGTLRGGTVVTDLTDTASRLTVSVNGGTLDGTAGAVTLAAGAQAAVSAGTTLTVTGSLANHGTLGLAGDSYNNIVAALQIAGTATLSGGGDVSLYAVTGGATSANQVITGASATAKLDNIDNTISGYGTIQAGQFKLINESAGTIEAAGGALVLDTGTNTVSNHGLLQGLGGTLVVQGVVDSTSGGIVATLNSGGVSGIVQLDGGTLRGGTLRTDPTDAASQIQITGAGGTLDGTAGALTVTASSQVVVVPGSTLTVEGAIANRGTMAVAGNGYYASTGELLVSGSVGLSGGGTLLLEDVSGITTATTSQVVTGATASGMLDNIDNLILGYGELGAAQMTLSNEAKGTIEAINGALQVDTGANTVTNKGLMESVGGTLVLRGVIDSSSGGTIAALNHGGTLSGTVLLDGATLHGGTIVTDLSDPASLLGLTANGGTLDGTAAAITISAGAQVEVAGSQTLVLEGTIADHGTLGVLGNGYYGEVATARLDGNVTLTGAGKLVMADVSGITLDSSSQVVTGTAATDTLDNVADTIIGFGSLGAGNMTLVNASAGTVEATIGTLVIDTGVNAAINQGLLEAVAGTLQLSSAVTNSGKIVAGAGGDVVIDSSVANTGLITAGNGGLMTLNGAITGASSTVQVAGGGTLVVVGGSIRGGTLSNAATGVIEIEPTGGTLASLAVTNAGTAFVVGNGYYGEFSTLSVAGTVTLSGAGAVVLADISGITQDSTSQTITGVAAGDTLDNLNNTIRGYGDLGAGQLTLINETKGTIQATVATMVLNTGSVALANHGVLEALGGVLVVQSVVDSAQGGAVEALNNGTVSGIVELDGGTLRGGTITTSLTDPGSALVFTANGGTLDGTAGSLTLAVGSHTTLTGGQTLTLDGAIAEHGTLDVFGNGYYGQVAAVDVAGTVTLSGGGTLALADVSGITLDSTSQVITGTAPGAELDNSAVITGFGMLGDGNLTLLNEAAGTIIATSGTLVVDPGTSSATNLGQMRAVSGTLSLENTLANQSTIAAGAAGSIIIDGTVNNTGLLSAASTAAITVHGSVVGASGTVQIAGGATLVLDGGMLNGGALSNAATGIVDVTTNGGTLASVAVSNAGTAGIFGNGYYGELATLAVSGTTTLSGGGTVVMADISGITSDSASQVITGLAAGDTLDNVDNTINGYGELGNGQLTFINETKGTIAATVATMVVNTGSVALTNHGLVEALGATLVVQSVIDSTAGGTVAALNLAALPGYVVLDGGTLRGGTITITGAGSALLLTANGGTLDGTAGTVTLAAGSQATVAAGETLTLDGAIAEHGTLDVLGNGYYGEVSTVDIGGTVTLSGSAEIALADASGITAASTSQVITGTAAGAELDNAALISGIGELGNGQLTLVNEATGTIDAIGGDLIVNAGAARSISNAGLMQALPGTLDVVSNLVNTGMVLVNGGTVVLEGSVTGAGKLGLQSSDLVLDGGVAASQTIAFYNFGTAETLDLANPGSIGATITGFATKDTIIVEGSTITAANYKATTGNLGTLALVDGTTLVGVLTLAGTYTAGEFKVTNVAGNPSIVTVTASTGQLYTRAVASTATPTVKNFGTHHVGDTLTQALTIKNTAATGSFTENLDVGFVATTGAAIDSGSITGLAAGITNSTSLSMGLSTASDGAQSGTVILTPSSDGTGIDGFGITPLTSQTITVSGALYNYATASAAPVDFGERHLNDTLSQKLSVNNTGTADGFTESLTASLGGATGAATGSGSFTGLLAGGTDSTDLTIGVKATQDGVQSGTVVLTPHSVGTGIDGFGSTLRTLQTIAATGTIFNYATASVGSKSLSLGAHHVGTALTGALTISNTGTADGFTENLDVGIASTTGALTADGSIVGLGAGKADTSSLTLGLPNTADGAQSSTVVLSLISDGAGIDNLGTTVLTAQTITASGTLYNYATASAATPGAVDFGTHHVGDTLSQALSITNTGAADGFTEKLDASIGGASGAAIASTSFTGLAAGKTNSSSVAIGLKSTQDGVRGGSGVLTLTSDGTGVDGLGTTILTTQTIDATGTLYNYATASTAGLVNLGNHHVGDTVNQALNVINTGTADGFTENLDASLGGATGAATASGSFTGLAAAKTDSSGLTIGVTTAQDGVRSGNAVLTLHSDGNGIDGLASTLRAAQTIAATGTIYNYATANSVAPVSFGNHHVGDTLSHALSITNIGTADGFTENLDAGIGNASGAVTASGVLSGLAAGIANTASLTVGLSSALDGAHGGTAVLGLKSDGSGVDGLGTTVLTAQTIAATGTLYNYATASAATPNAVTFGIHHVGDTLSQSLSISNIGKVDGFTENLDAGIGATTGAGTGKGSFTGLGAGNSNGTAVAIGLSSTQDGVQSGTTGLTLSSDGTGIDGLSTTVLAAQTIAVTGTLYNYATANVVGVVNLGPHHIGDALTKTLSITNTGPVDAYTEELDASIGGASAGAFASGSLNLDAPGHTNSTNLSVGLLSTTEGNHSGTATLALASDGSLVDGLGKTSLVAQTVTMTAAVFGYATPILSTGTLDFGAVRVGGTVAARSLTISNGGTADAFKENLGYALEAPSAGFALGSGATGTVAAGAAGATATLNLVTSTSGLFNTGTAVVDLTSLGAGTSGLANTALTSQKVALLAKVYAPAVAKLATAGFGVVHVGDAITVSDEISNVATGALTDVLSGGVGTITGSAFSGVTYDGVSLDNIGTAGLAAGAGGAQLAFRMNTGTAGTFSGSASLVLESHDAALADIAVNAGPILLSGTVDNYATAALEDVSGGGTFAQVGNAYTLDLGTVAAGAAALTVTLGALNAASGLADLMSGGFQISGSSAFLNSGMAAFSGLGYDQADTTPTVSLRTSNLGTFTETITLLGTGSNSSGYVGTLAPDVLTITGTVVNPARTLVWTGATSTDFSTASNWDDTTQGLDPATKAPTATDTVEFNGIGGGITGTGSAAALSINGGAWNLASGAAVATAGSAVIGSSQSGFLSIGGGSSLIDVGTAVIADQAGAGGSSVNVTGTGAAWQIGGSLNVGNAATGLLAITNGATVTTASLDAGVEASGAGIVTVSGPNADLVTTGTVSIGGAGSGELSILDGANATIGGDLNVANAGTGTGNVDIEDTTGTITFGGNIWVGYNGFGVFNIGYGVDYIQNNGGINFGSDSSGAINSFADPSPYLRNSSSNPIALGAQGVDQLAAYLYNSGEFTIPNSHTLTFDTPIISGGGSFNLGSNDSLILNADTVTGQTFTLGSDDKLTIGIDQLHTIQTPATGIANFSTVTNPNYGDPLIDHFNGVIANFTAGDVIAVDTDGAATFSQSGSVVSVIQNGNTLGTLTFDTAANAHTAATDGALVDSNTLCFCAGSLIGTPAGEVPVERLSVGDTVLTWDGGTRPIAWIGVGKVLATRGRRSAATPVIVRKNALADNVPARDLHLTKGHSLLIDGALIPVEFLVNHRSILWDDRAQEVSLYHVELDSHDVMVANGAPAESYRDDGNRWLFQNANSGWDLPPKAPCAPVLTGGPVVDAAWRRLLDRAGPCTALPLTSDADLHLVADGVRIDAIERRADIYVFRLPRRPHTVRIGSRAAVPQELGIGRDARQLGVAVRRIVLAEARRQQTLEADAASLSDGYHAFEADTAIRWTDGDAAVPAQLFAKMSGPGMLMVHLGGVTQYSDEGTAVRAA